MRSDTARLLNIIQLLVEIGVAAGFLLGLVPFVYLWSGGWVIALVFISLILSFVLGNGTLLFTLANVVLALLSFIPIVGFVTRAIGIVMSLLSISAIRRQIG
jgi:predicted branched-subunit amino acid permease